MCSSDSDDDCYGNVAQKLQSIKSKYVEDKIESKNLLDESKISCLPEENQKECSVTILEDTNISLNDSGELTLDSIIANNSTKRVTRTRNKKYQPEAETLPKRNPRRKNSASVPSLESNAEPPSKRSTGESSSVVVDGNSNRGRGRRRRGRQSAPNTSRRCRGTITDYTFPFGLEALHAFTQPSQVTQFLPTYSVGNTDEYPDMSDNQQLFTKNTNEVVVLEENDPLDENEELSVKVYWQSSEFYKFMIRKYQKLTQIFDYFAKKENVPHNKLFFMYNDNILKIDDTPDSINYSIVKFIDGGIVNKSVSEIATKTDEKHVINGLKLKFQCQNAKKPYEIVIKLEDKLSLAMMKCAEHFEKPFEKLKFYFDGDLISGKSTAKDLELEGGECIDVKIIS